MVTDYLFMDLFVTLVKNNKKNFAILQYFVKKKNPFYFTLTQQRDICAICAYGRSYLISRSYSYIADL